MIVRAVFTLIVIFLIFKLYQRLFQQKQCVACGKHIARQAAICHYCNTIQDGVELVQAEVGSARVAGNRAGRNRSRGRAMVLLGCGLALVVLSVAAAVWLMQS